MDIRVAGIVKESTVDGPGIRLVVFAQGCSRHCEHCQNPKSWNYDGGTLMSVEDIMKDIAADPLIDGVSFSGGECFDQPESFAYLADKIKEKYNFKIYTWSGYLYEELLQDEKKKKLLERIDFLIDGPFIYAKKSLTLKLRGSSNQRLIDVQKSLADNHVVEVD